ncbi:ectonucleotide pyrophosphatase/phosphodiesterase [Roseateles sp.]|uniref:alkaline phosphatase family protein n=1 Tax=Roseateles sp. TaxID=1971397 RepID=UPI0025D35E4D|nr:ectonucleotide pyrophosphatase/phosphodiesterase [Roseateles sp.]
MATAVTCLLAAAVFTLSGCATSGPGEAPSQPPVSGSAAARQPVTILISIDGFRDDYLRRGVSPTLSRLAAAGVTGIMHPSFPSKTFPNHWTLVTGLRPDRHGIVGNRMEASERKEVFTMATDDPWWWDAAPPVWVDAEKAGIRTAAMFWPGANVAFGGASGPTGTRPSDWVPYNQAVNDSQRVNTVLDWLRRPEEIRPSFVTLYFDKVDAAGHLHGPDGAQTTQAVAEVDAAIGTLVAGLKALGQPANLVIVADHGMAATSSERTIALDTLVDPSRYHLVETGTFASLAPLSGAAEEVERSLLVPHEHMQCWRKADIPARFHYGSNPRIPPILCLAEPGWLILASAPRQPASGGNHGYDNMAPEMNALFIAHGPAFAAGRVLPDFENVDIYPLLRRLIGLPAAAGVDGDGVVFRGVFRGGATPGGD